MKKAQKKTLVVVESPAKAKTIEKYLGKNRQVRDCDETQVEILGLILAELQDYLKENKITL